MILAPMQGLTEVLFRRIYEECFPGAIPLAVAPFIALTRNLRFSTDNAQIRDVLPENNIGSIPVTPQILGKEPEEFVLLANHLYALGYNEVNWNMGCPMRAVTAKHRGCGLMPHPDEVRAILDSVVPRLQGRLSVKVRLGLKEKEDIFRMVPVLNDYPLASVTVHPRLGRQQYTGVPDLETFGEVLPLLKAPVIYNGDLCTPDDIRRIKARFPQVADIMVGRGILYNPTLPLDLSPNSSPINHHSSLTKHFIRRLMEEIQRTLPTDETKIRKKKEYWSLLWRALPLSEMQARQVLRAQVLTIVDNLIDIFTQ
ncbi:MAG: tRNA-dihydrouridine synthase family protein [Bacteroidales bacterium]|nr:tRNA-dihydrouridine synthase family protein [Bacteroidales bacterium]